MTKALVDAKLTITGGITAPLFNIGTETSNIQIREKDGEKIMCITLPNKYRGATAIETYDMRSIIESIQELNRRTATISCTRKFVESLDIYDTNHNDTHNQFSCEQYVDGLPAASNGIEDDNSI